MSHKSDDDEDNEYEEDDFDDDGYDPDEPETYPDGLYDDDGPATIPCPHCGADVLEDSPRCPDCGMYLSEEDAPARSRSGLWMIVAILALVAVLISMFGCG
jgi:predicted nucleic acid-binding Zn ribbon protein